MAVNMAQHYKLGCGYRRAAAPTENPMRLSPDSEIVSFEHLPQNILTDLHYVSLFRMRANFYIFMHMRGTSLLSKTENRSFDFIHFTSSIASSKK